jgi:hypothetical protein
MMMFESMIERAEIWGWKGLEEVERECKKNI